jgi:hypothetical protein
MARAASGGAFAAWRDNERLLVALLPANRTSVRNRKATQMTHGGHRRDRNPAPQQSAATPDVLSFFGKPTDDAFATQEKAEPMSASTRKQ